MEGCIGSPYSKGNRASGFTLMELLVAMAIAAVIYGVGLPFGKKVFNKVYVFCDARKMGQLVGMYLSTTTLPDLTDVKDTVDFAVAWAKVGGPNEVSVYQSVKRKNKQHKKILIDGEKNPELALSDFDFMAYPVGTLLDMPPDEMPLFFSRGLGEKGVWSKDSLYGSDGGLIAFADGRVEKFHNAKEILSNYLEHLQLSF